ncbi:MAG: PP2C family protein-serine/threonine phosphatase [Planctomycetota bacterium]
MTEPSQSFTGCTALQGIKRLGWWMFLRTTMLGRGIRSELENFSLFIETAILHKALGEEMREVTLSVEREDAAMYLATHVTDPPEPLENTRHIAALMDHIGIKRIVLDTRLEANQFANVVEMLWGLRSRLHRPVQDPGCPDAAVAELTKAPGKRVSCTLTTLDRDTGTLTIRYSYCGMVFSHAVKRFKERTTNLFRDHRAFFRAAPRFAFIAMMIAGVPYILLAFTPGLGALGYALIFAAAAATCGSIAFLTYIIFQTLGSIEYDKEQQSWELEQAYKEISRVHRNIEADLNIARTIQEKLMPGPGDAPFPEQIAIARSFQPEMQVGGDYFDFKALDDSLLALIIADVSGHGMSAAFITGLIKTTFELSGDQRRSPSVFVTHLNRRLYEMIPAGSFATLFYGVYDVKTHNLRYVDAGHNPPALLVRANGEAVTPLNERGGMIAGVLADLTYEEANVRLQPGDKLALATDGITEARNPDQDEMFGADRMEKILADNADEHADALMDRLLGGLREFERGASPADDRAVLIMEVKRQ